MLRVASTCMLLVAALTTTAAGGPPKLTATVTKLSPTSRVVHIVNHDHVAYRNFLVVTLIKPVILRAPHCAVQRDGGFNGQTFVWKYTAACRRSLAPGRAVDIRLTTTPQGGNVFVYVVVKGVRSKIG